MNVITDPTEAAELLSTWPLDYNQSRKTPGGVLFCGKFQGLACCFRILAKDDGTAKDMRAALRSNSRVQSPPVENYYALVVHGHGVDAGRYERCWLTNAFARTTDYTQRLSLAAAQSLTDSGLATGY